MRNELVGSRRLVGWKRIANHLACGERTARRWEREDSLPVRRQQLQGRSLVYAFPSELDTWIASRAPEKVASATQEKARQGSRLRLSLSAIAALALIVLGVSVTHSIKAPKTVTPVSLQFSEDLIATELYHRGLGLWAQRGDEPIRRAIKLLSAAVERDEGFALAWAALASAWLTYPTYSNQVDLDEAIREALLSADRAVRLDPQLVETRSVMAKIAQMQGDWVEADRIYNEAIDADPQNATLLLWLADQYLELGLLSEAEALIDASLEIDPYAPPTVLTAAIVDYQSGRTDSSLHRFDHLWFELGFDVPQVWFGRWLVLIDQAAFDDARDWIHETPFSNHAPLLEAYVDLSRDGSFDQEFGQQVERAYDNALPAWVSFHLLDRSGLQDEAFYVLEAEAKSGGFLHSEVLFFANGSRPWRSNRFSNAVAPLGFPEYWQQRSLPDICGIERQASICIRRK